jgi:hypothetical protein
MASRKKSVPTPPAAGRIRPMGDDFT